MSYPNRRGTNGKSVFLECDTDSINWQQTGDIDWKELVPFSLITGPGGSQGVKGDDGAPGQPASQGVAGAPNVLSIGTVTTGAAGSSAGATITGTSPSQVLNLTIPRGNTGVGLSPTEPAGTTIALNTAYQNNTTKTVALSVMVEVNYSITIAAALADTMNLMVGTSNTVMTSGTAVACWRSALTGIALSIGMGSSDRGQLFALIPPGGWYAVTRPEGTRATIQSAFLTPLN